MWGRFGAAGRGRGTAAAAELALIAALAEEGLDQLALDRIARGAVTEVALAGLDWDWLLERAEQLRAEAPLFSEAREQVVAELARSSVASPALAFAARLVSGSNAGEAQALLSDLARRLGLSLPSPAGPLPGLTRARFDDPEDATEVPFHVALARAEAEERRLLLGKLQLARACLRRLGGRSRILELGPRIPMGPILLRLDASISGPDGVYNARLLAAEEALHPAEHGPLAELAARLPPGERLLVGHASPLWPPDAAALAALPTETCEQVALGPKM